MSLKPTKVSIIGTGFVGSTTAYTLMISGLISELVLVDIDKEKAEGEVLDLNHGMPFVQPVKITAGDYADCEGSSIVIITAGANQKPDETRLDLVKKNTEVFKSIIPKIVKHCPEAVLLVVTNPVDILTYVTYKISGLEKNKVMGSGTVLDTARFKYQIGQELGVDARNVHSYILGEHGDSEVPAWSLTSIAGMSLDAFCQQYRGCDGYSQKEISEDVKNAAYDIIQRKGATYYAVALTVRRIVEAILRNEHSILTVSSLVEDYYGLSDICLSLPTIVNSRGIDHVLKLELSEDETNALIESGKSLKKVAEMVI